jgi:hypothetical protein
MLGVDILDEVLRDIGNVIMEYGDENTMRFVNCFFVKLGLPEVMPALFIITYKQ